MRILGIDYGEKRIGLALSDELPMLAREYAIVSPKQFWDSIGQLVVEYEVGEVVVGWPIGMSGQETDKTREVAEFIKRLEQSLVIPVTRSDERLSSHMARKLPGGNKDVDSLAAQIMLQNYIDKRQAL